VTDLYALVHPLPLAAVFMRLQGSQTIPAGYRLMSCLEALQYSDLILPLTIAGDQCKVAGGAVLGLNLNPTVDSYTVLCPDPSPPRQYACRMITSQSKEGGWQEEGQGKG
jgi:hypothetical protein